MISDHDLISLLPKAELHVHLEGTLEPKLLFALAARNAVALPWGSVEEVTAAYSFADLPEFLSLLWRAAGVLRTRQDFYDLTIGYLCRAAADGVVRAEMFFGAQTFLDLGISLADQLEGVLAAVDDARAQWGIDGAVLLTAQRHRSQGHALELLELSRPWRSRLLGFGLGGAERDNPPQKFTEYFRLARAAGHVVCAHAGEDGPPEYISAALDECRVDRIDHGIAAAGDLQLVARLRDEQVPLTVCPLSNVSLHVVDSLADHPLGLLLDAGVLVSVNSDDPAYFGGYVNDNYHAVADALALGRADVVQLIRNSFSASFLPDSDVRAHHAAIESAAP